MVDSEVTRLRRLRRSALRVRAVARALAASRVGQDDPLLGSAACAAWRIARAVSGRLRAHPYVSFQRDESVGSIISNSVVAVCVSLTATSRSRAFKDFSRRLRKMSRELADSRAVTLTPDLSDAFGRSLAEFRPLVVHAEKEARAVRSRNALPSLDVGQGSGYAASESNWPYLAL